MHRFCRDCVATHGQPTATSTTCPFPGCAWVTKKAPDQLTVDRRALHLAAEETAARTTQAVPKCEFACPEGEEEAATHRCTTCGIMMCASCTTAHAKIKMMKSHTVYLLADGAGSADGGGGGGEAPMFFCKTHKDKPLEVFCATCCMLICLKCAVLEHKGTACVIGDLEPTAAASRAELAPVMAKVAARVPELKQASTALKAAITAVGVQKDEAVLAAKAHCTAMRKAITKCEGRLVAAAEAEAAKKSKALEDQDEGVEEFAEHAENTLAYTAWLVEAGGDSAVLEALPLLHHGLAAGTSPLECRTTFLHAYLRGLYEVLCIERWRDHTDGDRLKFFIHLCAR